MVTVSSILYLLVVGLIIGLIAAAIMKDKGLGWGWSIALGILGSVVGSFLFSLVGMTQFGLIGQIIVGVIGACILLAIAGVVRRNRPAV